jgi:hypothetical protein
MVFLLGDELGTFAEKICPIEQISDSRDKSTFVLLNSICQLVSETKFFNRKNLTCHFKAFIL